MSAEEPETEAGAANDATEVVDDDFSTRLRNVAGGQAETQEAWSDEDDADDDDEPQSQPWSVVTGHAAALNGGGRGGGSHRRAGLDHASQRSTSPFPRVIAGYADDCRSVSLTSPVDYQC